MDWLVVYAFLLLSTALQGLSLKCGEEIVVQRGEKKVLRFWSAEDEVLNVDVFNKLHKLTGGSLTGGGGGISSSLPSFNEGNSLRNEQLEYEAEEDVEYKNQNNLYYAYGSRLTTLPPSSRSGGGNNSASDSNSTVHEESSQDHENQNTSSSSTSQQQHSTNKLIGHKGPMIKTVIDEDSIVYEYIPAEEADQQEHNHYLGDIEYQYDGEATTTLPKRQMETPEANILPHLNPQSVDSPQDKLHTSSVDSDTKGTLYTTTPKLPQETMTTTVAIPSTELITNRPISIDKGSESLLTTLIPQVIRESVKGTLETQTPGAFLEVTELRLQDSTDIPTTDIPKHLTEELNSDFVQTTNETPVPELNGEITETPVPNFRHETEAPTTESIQKSTGEFHELLEIRTEVPTIGPSQDVTKEPSPEVLREATETPTSEDVTGEFHELPEVRADVPTIGPSQDVTKQPSPEVLREATETPTLEDVTVPSETLIELTLYPSLDIRGDSTVRPKDTTTQAPDIMLRDATEASETPIDTTVTISQDMVREVTEVPEISKETTISNIALLRDVTEETTTESFMDVTETTSPSKLEDTTLSFTTIHPEILRHDAEVALNRLRDNLAAHSQITLAPESIMGDAEMPISETTMAAMDLTDSSTDMTEATEASVNSVAEIREATTLPAIESVKESESSKPEDNTIVQIKNSQTAETTAESMYYLNEGIEYTTEIYDTTQAEKIDNKIMVDDTMIDSTGTIDETQIILNKKSTDTATPAPTTTESGDTTDSSDTSQIQNNANAAIKFNTDDLTTQQIHLETTTQAIDEGTATQTPGTQQENTGTALQRSDIPGTDEGTAPHSIDIETITQDTPTVNQGTYSQATVTQVTDTDTQATTQATNTDTDAQATTQATNTDTDTQATNTDTDAQATTQATNTYTDTQATVTQATDTDTQATTRATTTDTDTQATTTQATDTDSQATKTQATNTDTDIQATATQATNTDTVTRGTGIQSLATETSQDTSTDISSTDISSADISHADISSTDISSTDISSADISTTEISSTDISSSDISSTDISTADILTTDISSADISTTDISTTDILNADISSADISSTDISSTDISNTDISNTDISTTDISTTDISNTDISSTITQSTTTEAIAIKPPTKPTLPSNSAGDIFQNIIDRLTEALQEGLPVETQDPNNILNIDINDFVSINVGGGEEIANSADIPSSMLPAQHRRPQKGNASSSPEAGAMDPNTTSIIDEAMLTTTTDPMEVLTELPLTTTMKVFTETSSIPTTTKDSDYEYPELTEEKEFKGYDYYEYLVDSLIAQNRPLFDSSTGDKMTTNDYATETPTTKPSYKYPGLENTSGDHKPSNIDKGGEAILFPANTQNGGNDGEKVDEDLPTTTMAEEEFISTTPAAPEDVPSTSSGDPNSTTAFSVPLVVLRNQEMLNNLLNNQGGSGNSKIVITEQGSRVSINSATYAGDIQSDTTTTAQLQGDTITPLPSVTTTPFTSPVPVFIASKKQNADSLSSGNNAENSDSEGQMNAGISGDNNQWTTEEVIQYPLTTNVPISNTEANIREEVHGSEQYLEDTTPSVTQMTNEPDAPTHHQETENLQNNSVHSNADSNKDQGSNSHDAANPNTVGGTGGQDIPTANENSDQTQNKPNELTTQRTTESETMVTTSEPELATLLIPFSFVQYLGQGHRGPSQQGNAGTRQDGEGIIHESEPLPSYNINNNPGNTAEELLEDNGDSTEYETLPISNSPLLSNQGYDNQPNNGNKPVIRDHFSSTYLENSNDQSESNEPKSNIGDTGDDENNNDYIIREPPYTADIPVSDYDNENIKYDEGYQDYADPLLGYSETELNKESEVGLPIDGEVNSDYDETKFDNNEKEAEYDEAMVEYHEDNSDYENTKLDYSDTNAENGDVNLEYSKDNVENGDANFEYSEDNVENGDVNLEYSEDNAENGDANFEYSEDNAANGDAHLEYTEDNVENGDANFEYSKGDSDYNADNTGYSENNSEYDDTNISGDESRPEYVEGQPIISGGQIGQAMSRKDDNGQNEYGGDSPFFIKLPGSPNAVPVYLQYEPVHIKYVSSDQMQPDSKLDTTATSPDSSSSSSHGQSGTPDRAMKVEYTASENSDQSGDRQQEVRTVGTTQTDGSLASSLMNGIYRILDGVSVAANNYQVDSQQGSTQFTSHKPIVERPDPFFLMEPPQLGSQTPSQNSQSPGVQEASDGYRVQLSSKLGIADQPSTGSASSKGTVEDVPIGTKDDILYPGDYYKHDSYTGVNPIALVNPVFELNTRATTQSEDERMNPQYTPFPITQNPPRTTPSTQENYLPYVTPDPLTPSTNIGNTPPFSSHVTEAPTPKTPHSVEFSPIPAANFEDSYDSDYIPEYFYDNENAIVAPLPSSPEVIEALTLPIGNGRLGGVLQETRQVSAAPFIISDEAVPKEVPVPDAKPDPSIDVTAHQQVWSSPESRVLPGAINEPRYRVVEDRQDDDRVYTAFYSPREIPGIDPAIYGYRKVQEDYASKSNSAALTVNRYQPPRIPESAAYRAAAPYASHHTTGGGPSQPQDGHADQHVLGPQFFKYLNSMPYAMLHKFLDPSPSPPLSRKKRSEGSEQGAQIFCEWNIKTDPGLYLLMTFHNLSAAYTVDCHGAYIEVERENNGYDARWCGNRVSQAGSRPHVIFAKTEVRITVYDDGDSSKDLPTGFEADIEVIDLFDARDYKAFMRSNAYPHIRRLLDG